MRFTSKQKSVSMQVEALDALDRYAVMGNPISHSKSPYIHHLFAKQCRQHIKYDSILVDLNGLPQALDDFQNKGGKGVNITLPFKPQAFALMDDLSDRAVRAKAVNIIHFKDDGSRYGDNTDGVGLVRDLVFNHHFSLKNKRILIIGAGGAVQGILESLIKEEPEHINIVNRTQEKAITLAALFADLGSVSAMSFDGLKKNQFDLVINGTSASLQGKSLNLPNGILRKNSCCYEMVYGRGITPFLRWANQQKAEICGDGTGMLVEQAAESFYIWRGIRPETQNVLKNLE